MAYRTQRPASRMKSGVAHVKPRNGEALVPPKVLAKLVLKTKAEWQQQIELGVKVSGLPPNIDTLSLKKAFEKEGNIVYVTIYDSHGSRDGTGLLRFSPPPDTAFWTSGLYTARIGKSSYNLKVVPQHSTKTFKIPSPIRKHILYDEVMVLKASSLDFGMMLSATSLMLMHTVESSRPDNLLFSVDLRRKRIMAEFEIHFRDPRSPSSVENKGSHSLGYLDRINTFRFEMPFGLLRGVQKIDIDETKFGMIITLDSPPRFFKKLVDDAKTHLPDGQSWSEHDTWWRHTDIVYDPYRLKITRVSLAKERPVVDIGRWRTYRFVFPRSHNQIEKVNMLEAALHDFNIEVKQAIVDIIPEVSSPLWAMVDPVYTRHLLEADTSADHHSKQLSADLFSLENGENMAVLPFEVRYQLEVCISRDFINEFSITETFIRRLSQMSMENPAKARCILEYVAEQAKRIYDPMVIFDDPSAIAYSPRTTIPNYCGYTRKATVTPTTVIYSSPTVEITNRVTRHYKQENEDGRFLRVQFTDEDFQGRINSNAGRKCDDELYTRVYRTLYNGIQIGDRHYEFLAFGNSQFRENGAYFFCPTEHLSCTDIREWMGSFKHIRVPAKYAARLGQCFSTTRAINGMSAPVLVKIADIERNGYCFTDGVGKISKFLAKIIAADLKLSTTPSAFQFRLGGCKGILVVSEDAKGKEVHIRKSQQKFIATYNGLEVIRWSRFSSATLNRQTITILSALGVEDGVFLDMLTEQLANYQSAMIDNELALKLLARYIDDNHMTLNIASMILNGFMTCRDPFVLSLLHLWRSWSIKLLKEKAKIIVEEGAFLLGCVDETGQLKGWMASSTTSNNSTSEDDLPEIFLQVPDREDPKQYKVIEGVCLIGRNPSLHPGDIRIVKAVDIEELRHLRDVVVFPQHGDRDIPSMCSGGDLDGDDFFVIWDKKLRPHEWNNAPMNYEATMKPNELDRSVKVTDLIKFFVRFMKNDALPTIAHAHLAQADWLTHGVKDPKCLELAGLHSKAVDYVKTGQPAEMPKRLRVSKWPHFMEKKHKSMDKIYHSTKVLGQLYDRVESVDFKPQYEEPFDKRILRAYKLDSLVLKTARQVKSQYDTAVRRIMAQQEISTEFEVWTTFVLSKPRVGSDYKVQEDMDKISGALKARFQEVCYERAGSKDFDVMGPFVAAMYRVTKEELDIALAECRTKKIVGGKEVPKRKMEPKFMPLISFPWLFEKELGRIATGSETFEDTEELSLRLVLHKGAAGQSRMRQGAEENVEDDFIKLDDGVVVHRGEELDLFRPDLGLETRSDEDDHESLYQDHRHSGGQAEELVLDTGNLDPMIEAYPIKDLLGMDDTGVEDVVPRTVLDGFVNRIQEAHLAHNTAHVALIRGGRAESESISLSDIPQGTPSESPISAASHVVVHRNQAANEVEASPDTPSISDDDDSPIEEEIFLDDIQSESALDRLARLMGES